LQKGRVPAVADFLRARSGRLFLFFLALCAVGSAAFGVVHYRGHLNAFVAAKFAENSRMLRLEEAFVGHYSEVRGEFLGQQAPVPASFRAYAIDRFNAEGDPALGRLSWVGLPGREMRVPPRDRETADILVEAAKANDVSPRSYWRSIQSEQIFRTIYPAVAKHESCVECHNSELNGRLPWRLNDIMGAFVFDVSADRDLAHVRRETVLFALGVFVVAVVAGLTVFWLQYKRHTADVLAAKLLERERVANDAKEAAEAANRAKSEFLALMSHELRTPLNAINGFSQLIVQQILGPVDERYREYAEDIHRSGNHLLTVIGDILEIAKAESGRLQLYKEETTLEDIIGPCVRTIAVRAHASGIELIQHVKSDSRLIGDTTKLRQVILNLLSNAVKFTPGGGRVVITANVARDGGATIEVVDSGIGIAAQDIPRIMSPFEQVESQVARRREGTGLGLPLAKLLVELHGGSLLIESALGRGTRVLVSLPIQMTVHSPRRDGGPSERLVA
jgi:signal transduction histidine kinase